MQDSSDSVRTVSPTDINDEHKVLYSELQPCVLIACCCSPDEPFLLLIRGIQQVVTCGFCGAAYQIECASYDIRQSVHDAAPDIRLTIRRIPRPDSEPQPKPN